MSDNVQIDVMTTLMGEPNPAPTRFVVIVDQRHPYYLTYDQVKAAMAKFDRMLAARDLKPHEMICGRCHADMSKQLGCAGCRADCTGMAIFTQLHAGECEGCAAGVPLTMGTHRVGKGGPGQACAANIDGYDGAIR